MKERFTRLAPSSTADVDAASRVVRYVFSDESIGRDGHIIKADAWRIENFVANPVFMWCHDDSVPPIGKVFGLNTVGRTLCGAVRYAESDFADTIYQLVREGMLNATSTSWQPLEWERMGTPGGGFIFTDVDLLEISQVNVPALPTALAQAGARGINLKPLRDWSARALDTGRYHSQRREHLEALYRAANGSRLTLVPSDLHGGAARARRVQEIMDIGERRERARKIILRGQRELTDANEKKLQEVQHHHDRAMKHQRSLGRAHDKLAEQAGQLRSVHKRMTKTLADLGIDDSRMARAMGDLDRCSRDVVETHGSADDAGVAIGDSLIKAQTAVSQVIDGDVGE